MYTGVHAECSLVFSGIIYLKIFRHVSKNQKPNLLKIQWQPNCSVRTDGRIDRTKLIAAFPSFANKPKIGTKREALTSCIS